MESSLDQADLVLLLLAAETANPAHRFRCNGITRLEKLLFLVEKETAVPQEIQSPFSFEAYHYGPYSREVYDSVDLLRSLRLLDERRVDVATGLDVSEEASALDAFDTDSADAYVERQLFLTPDGKDIARVLSTRLSPASKKALAVLKDRYGTMPLRQLLRYVYGKYPEYATRSRISSSL